MLTIERPIKRKQSSTGIHRGGVERRGVEASRFEVDREEGGQEVRQRPRADADAEKT
jgi:hypothetical protein